MKAVLIKRCSKGTIGGFFSNRRDDVNRFAPRHRAIMHVRGPGFFQHTSPSSRELPALRLTGERKVLVVQYISSALKTLEWICPASYITYDGILFRVSTILNYFTVAEEQINRLGIAIN